MDILLRKIKGTLEYSETSEYQTPTGLWKSVRYWEVPTIGGNFKKTITFGTQRFVRYLGCPLLGGFTVFLRQIIRIAHDDFSMSVKHKIILSWPEMCLINDLNLPILFYIYYWNLCVIMFRVSAKKPILIFY